MIFSDAELSVLDCDIQRIGVFFRLDTTPAVRLWLGVGPIDPGATVYDPSGAEYSGFGELPNVPSFSQLINGAAERVEFSLSGVSDQVLALAASEANLVQGVATDLGIGIMDQGWALLGSVKWIRRGYASHLSLNRSPAQGLEEPSVQTVSLSVGSLMTGRKRGAAAYYTDQDQQFRSPGDRFCERTVKYSQGVTKPWPRF